MSLRIRLRRMGKKKRPHYRIVAADSRAPRDGRFVENLGYYDPIPDPATLSVDLARVDHWLGRGAVLSPTVRSLMSKARAGGDDSVALAKPASEADTEPEAPPENGAAAEAAGDAGTPDARGDTTPAADSPGADAEAGDAAESPDPSEGEDAGEDATGSGGA